MSNSAEVIQIHDAKSRPARSDELAGLRGVAERLSAEIVQLRNRPEMPLKATLSPEVAEGPGRHGLLTFESDPEVIKVILEALSSVDIARRGRVRSELPQCFLPGGSCPTPRSILMCDCEAFYSFCEIRQTVEVTLVARHNPRSDGFSLEQDRPPAVVLPRSRKPKGTVGRLTAVAAGIVVSAICVGSLYVVFHSGAERHTRAESGTFAISSRASPSLDELLVRIGRMERMTGELAKYSSDFPDGFSSEDWNAMPKFRLTGDRPRHLIDVAYRPEALLRNLRHSHHAVSRTFDSSSFLDQEMLRDISRLWFPEWPPRRRAFVFQFTNDASTPEHVEAEAVDTNGPAFTVR